MIPQWQSSGYRVELVFLKLRSIRLAQSRVRERVRQGGHSVAAAVIGRRFRKGWQNFEVLYKPLVNAWRLYDNSGAKPVLLDEGVQHETTES
jgi:predicted ABC-type ATPase